MLQEHNLCYYLPNGQKYNYNGYDKWSIPIMMMLTAPGAAAPGADAPGADAPGA